MGSESDENLGMYLVTISFGLFGLLLLVELLSMGMSSERVMTASVFVLGPLIWAVLKIRR